MRLSRPLPVLILVLFVCSSNSRMFAQRSGSEKPAYLNPALSIEVRVDDLVPRMTLEERASQVGGDRTSLNLPKTCSRR